MASGLLKKAPQLSYSVSVTTRAPRPGEKEGVDYYYIQEKEFIKKRDNGELLEYACVHGYWYGTLRSFIEERINSGEDVLLDIDVQGGEQIKKSAPDAALVFIVPPSLNALETRLRGRQKDDEQTIQRRLKRAHEEMRQSSKYDYLILNDTVSQALDQLYSIYTAEKLRMEKNGYKVSDILNAGEKELNKNGKN